METASYWTYGIFDPRTGLCVYVGQTSDFKARCRQHLATHRTKKTKYGSGSIKTWLCAAHAAKIEPIILPLELVETEEESLISESKWVDRLGRALGHPLRNLWEEHRDILHDGQSGQEFDALVFPQNGEKKPPTLVGRMRPNNAKSGYYLEPTINLFGVKRIDFLPPRDQEKRIIILLVVT